MTTSICSVADGTERRSAVADVTQRSNATRYVERARSRASRLDRCDGAAAATLVVDVVVGPSKTSGTLSCLGLVETYLLCLLQLRPIITTGGIGNYHFIKYNDTIICNDISYCILC